jgi:hypothetical protein
VQDGHSKPAALAQAPGGVRGLLGHAVTGLVGYARFGFAAKGVLQLLIGALALAAAMGERSGRVTDAAGALRSVVREPFGRPVVLLVAVGVLGYAAFKFVEGVLDPRRRPTGIRTGLFRLGDLFSGVAYLLLGIGAFQLFLRSGAPVSSDARTRYWTSEALALPYGDGILLLAAAVFGGIAALFLARALFVRDVCADLDVDALGPTGCRAAATLIRIASLVQATLFGTVAYLLLRAAEVHDAGQVRGTGGALRLLTAHHGRLALGLLAAGMLAMGLSSFVEARWRKMT